MDMTSSEIIILEDNRKATGWITAIIENRWCQAKVYDDPSTFGINDGRVSKLAVGKLGTVKSGQNFFDQIDFNYDRGLDFDNLPDGVLDAIVSVLEKLPKVFEDAT